MHFDEALTLNPAVELFNGPYDGPLSLILGSLDSSDLYSLWMSDSNLQFPREFLAKRTFTISDELDSASVSRMLSFLQLFQSIQIGVKREHLAILEQCPDLRHLDVRSESAKSGVVLAELMRGLDVSGKSKSAYNHYSGMSAIVLVQRARSRLDCPPIVAG